MMFILHTLQENTTLTISTTQQAALLYLISNLLMSFAAIIMDNSLFTCLSQEITITQVQQVLLQH